MKLPRTEDTALLLCVELAKTYKKNPVSLSFIAKKHGISFLFLKKLALYLRASGIIQSKEGNKGGYTLAKSPRSISVWDIMDSLHKDEMQKTLSIPVCPIAPSCLPQSIRNRITASLEQSLSKISLEELV
jgi:Rrf2 family protein